MQKERKRYPKEGFNEFFLFIFSISKHLLNFIISVMRIVCGLDVFQDNLLIMYADQIRTILSSMTHSAQ